MKTFKMQSSNPIFSGAIQISASIISQKVDETMLYNFEKIKKIKAEKEIKKKEIITEKRKDWWARIFHRKESDEFVLDYCYNPWNEHLNFWKLNKFDDKISVYEERNLQLSNLGMLADNSSDGTIWITNEVFNYLSL